MKAYDLLVIGSGTAAQVASARVRAVGWQVAVIDHRPFGGTCALRGCDPKKMLVSASEAIDAAHRMRGHGVAGGLSVDWSELLAFRRAFTERIPGKQEKHYRDLGIDVFHGLARFVGPNAIAIESTVLQGRHVLIATGARPVLLNIPGEEYAVTSERFLGLQELPARIAMVGGGYIAAEFSQIAARAGAQVTVFQRAERLLPSFDPDVVGWLMDTFRRLGIDVRPRTTVRAIERTEKDFLVHTTSDNDAPAVACDLVVHAAGRVPDLEDLDLSAGGIETENGRIKLNEFLQSASNAHVYAAGDAAAKGPPLTPVSSHDGKVVAANLLEGNRHRPDYRGVPSVAFTLPPVASVGMSEVEARKQGRNIRMKALNASNWFTARRLAEPVYGFKVLVDADTDEIVGAHLVGPHADEVINLLALAIRHGLTARQLKSTMFAYPTGASDLGYML